MEFKVITNIDSFLKIEKDYNDLVSRIEEYQVFYEFAWLKNYLLYFPPLHNIVIKDHLSIVVGYDGKRLLFLAPFYLHQGQLRFILEDATDYNAILIDKNINCHDACKKFLKFISENIKLEKIWLSCFRQSDVLLNLHAVMSLTKEEAKTQEYVSFLKIQTIAPYLYFDKDSTKLIAKQIANIKRRQRNIESEYSLRFEESDVISEDEFDFLTKFKLKKYGNGIYSDRKTWNFLQGVMKDMKESICVHKCFIDDKLAAIHFGFKDKEKIYYYVPVYDSSWQNLGVGKMLVLHAIESAKNNGYKQFDFMRGHELYKFDVCDRIAINYTFTAFPITKKNKLKIFLFQHFSKRGL